MGEFSVVGFTAQDFDSLPASCYLWPIVQPGPWAVLGLSVVCVSVWVQGGPGVPLPSPLRSVPASCGLDALPTPAPGPLHVWFPLFSFSFSLGKCPFLGEPFPSRPPCAPIMGARRPDARGSRRGECGGLLSILAVGLSPCDRLRSGTGPCLAHSCSITTSPVSERGGPVLPAVSGHPASLSPCDGAPQAAASLRSPRWLPCRVASCVQ